MNDTPSSPSFRMTICGLAELPDHSGKRVSHVLSILDPAEPEPAAFSRYGEHERLELRFHDIIEERVPGYESPQPHHIDTLLAFGRDIGAGSPDRDIHVLVHCHMGISRSTAASVLLLTQAEPGWSSDRVMAEVARIRPKAWPNLRMIEIGDGMLGRKGDLVRVVRARHRELAEALPQVANFMRDCGRARELD
ncbi:MAG TPA: protein-tyrosine-phosphatase [Alphaproteobacteria bacterium]|nr:protein-tyrosine-phosphatase [Alphaproteobacteria bacterium]